jgi:hypothetical protein
MPLLAVSVIGFKTLRLELGDGDRFRIMLFLRRIDRYRLLYLVIKLKQGVLSSKTKVSEKPGSNNCYERNIGRSYYFYVTGKREQHDLN